MATITDVTQLDAAVVTQNQALMTQLVQEQHPDVDAKRGVLADLVFHFGGGICGAWNQANLDNVRQSQSLLAVNANPALADPTIVDGILSNFGVTRQQGTNATGQMTIVVSSLTPTTIGNSQVFSANGQNFLATSSFTAQTTSANVQSSTDRLLVALGDGTYAFTINMVAVSPGAASNISRNTAMVPQAPPQNFVRAYAAVDFTGGFDTETNAQVLKRMQIGIAAKAMSNRTNMNAFLHQYTSVPAGTLSSIIGFGDAEMLRDAHTIFPLSFGGRVDWYIRTADLPVSTGYTVTATLMSKTIDGYGIWQFALNRTQSVGFYDVVQIVQHGAVGVLGTYQVQSDTRQADLTDPGPLPDIANGNEAAYSAYQTAIIQFKDTDTVTTLLSVGATRQYDIVVRGMPTLGTLQGIVYGRGARNYGGDLLVKAPIPCFLSVSFSINLKAGDPQPNTDTIRNNLANLVNRYGFTGRLPASILHASVQDSLAGTASLSAIEMFGRIRRPDGTIKPIRSTEVLIVPNEPQNMVTARTVAFILDPNSVGISVQTVAIPDI